MSQALRKLAGAINRSNTCVIFINQLREKIGVMFGNPETTPGGRALKFFASIRMDIRRTGALKDSGSRVIGSRTRVKVVKNKIAPPFTECEFDIMYNEGISRTGSLLDLGLEYNIVEKKGSWLAYKGKMLGQGREASKQALAKDEAMMEEIQTAIYQKVKVAGGTVLGESAGEGANGDEL